MYQTHSPVSTCLLSRKRFERRVCSPGQIELAQACTILHEPRTELGPENDLLVGYENLEATDDLG